MSKVDVSKMDREALELHANRLYEEGQRQAQKIYELETNLALSKIYARELEKSCAEKDVEPSTESALAAIDYVLRETENSPQLTARLKQRGYHRIDRPIDAVAFIARADVATQEVERGMEGKGWYRMSRQSSFLPHVPRANSRPSPEIQEGLRKKGWVPEFESAIADAHFATDSFKRRMWKKGWAPDLELVEGVPDSEDASVDFEKAMTKKGWVKDRPWWTLALPPSDCKAMTTQALNNLGWIAAEDSYISQGHVVEWLKENLENPESAPALIEALNEKAGLIPKAPRFIFRYLKFHAPLKDKKELAGLGAGLIGDVVCTLNSRGTMYFHFEVKEL